MNNLVITAFIAAVGSALLWNGQRQIAAANSAASATQAEIQIAAGAAMDALAESARLEKLFILQQESIEKIRIHANEAAAKAVAAQSAGDLSPLQEGSWPQDKPYFYLSKRHLQALDYWPVSDDDERISSAAITLFGMSPDEEKSANATYKYLRQKIREAEVAMAVPTNTPSKFDGWAGTKQSIYLPAVPPETLNALNHEFRSALTQALGEERAALLSGRLDENIKDTAYSAGRARTLTLIRNGEKITLAETDENDNMTSSSSTDSDGRQIVPHFIRHLFAE